ncbi:MAG TPA: zeta toxin family protein [Gemmataceae bacterium]|jgi:predicted ABC-type ATPase|nr:zeta toxin family protein [Gemmataceae bacterium]
MPTVVVLGGINGAGKTTSARPLLVEVLGCPAFVNADEIARGLNGFAPEDVAFDAGRIMLERLRQLSTEGADFAFETTLAGRSYLPFLRRLKVKGYRIELHYVWLASPELAVGRVRTRVARGGHHIPEATISQRFPRTINNFWSAYRSEADSWAVYDNSGLGPMLTAAGAGPDIARVSDPVGWESFRRLIGHA